MSQKQLTAHRAAHASVGKHPDRLSRAALPAGRRGHAEEPSDRPAGGFSRILRGLLLPLAVTALSGVVWITVLSAVAYRSSDPTSLILPLTVTALEISSLAGGIAAGKCGGEGAVGHSLVSGCFLAAVLCLCTLLRGGGVTGMPAVAGWLIRISVVPMHLLGGLLVRPRKKPASHTAVKHPAHRGR